MTRHSWRRKVLISRRSAVLARAVAIDSIYLYIFYPSVSTVEVLVMKKNVGKTDRIIRVVIGVIITAMGIYFKSWWGLLAIIPFATAAMGFCGLYVPFKINTIKKK